MDRIRIGRPGSPLLVVLISALAALGESGIQAQDWPQFRGPNRDGESAEQGLLTQWPDGGPRLVWSVQGVVKGFTQVAVAEGLVYVTGLEGKEGIPRAYTLDGKPKWEANGNFLSVVVC